MHMFGEKGISLNFKWQLTSTSTVIARFCRAFFMHKGDSLWSITTKVKSDCPVLSGFFHARQYLADNYPECEICVCDCPVLSGFFHARSWRDKICSGSMIARLCRAFFMHFAENLLLQIKNCTTRDCPVMSGFFHSLLNN